MKTLTLEQPEVISNILKRIGFPEDIGEDELEVYKERQDIINQSFQ